MAAAEANGKAIVAARIAWKQTAPVCMAPAIKSTATAAKIAAARSSSTRSNSNWQPQPAAVAGSRNRMSS